MPYKNKSPPLLVYLQVEVKSDNYRPFRAEDINYELNLDPPQLQISQNYN